MDTININGHEIPLGCLPRVSTPGTVAGMPLFADRIPMIPRGEWKPVDNSHLVLRIHNQNGYGACNGEAATGTLEVCRVLAGSTGPALSAGNLYGQINGGQDQGSMLGDALEALLKTGVCSTSTIPSTEWPDGTPAWKKSKWPSGWAAEAKSYRIIEAYDAPDFDSLASAIQRGFMVDLGILVGSNFNPGSDGWIPYPPSGQKGGHAMLGIGLAQKGSKWGIKVANSWDLQWGQAGYGIIPEQYFGGDFTDGWAIRTAISTGPQPQPAGV